MAFWNVAELGNENKNFWKSVINWEVMVQSDTWIEEKDWRKIKNKLPQDYVWGWQAATRTHRRGRARGKMMGIRKEIIEKGSAIVSQEVGIMIAYVKQGKERWRIIGMYKGGVKSFRPDKEKTF